MKVSEVFEAEKIDLDFIENKFDGSYWENCYNFVNDYWNVDIDNLSIKQGSWLTKILDDCTEKRIEG